MHDQLSGMVIANLPGRQAWWQEDQAVKFVVMLSRGMVIAYLPGPQGQDIRCGQLR